MAKRISIRDQVRAAREKARAVIVPQFERMEKEFGEVVVRSIFNRRQAVRAAKRKLLAEQREVNARIAELES